MSTVKRIGWFLVPILFVACSSRDGGSSRKLIQSKGSDTLVNVAQAWAEAYKDVDPTMMVSVSGGGSGTGISAMINGTADLANSSRKMKQNELELARKNGIDPQEFIVGYDALAVFVHHTNPLDELALTQLAEIYGDGGKFEIWNDLGVEIPGCKSGEIVRVSRQNNSGTFAYFKDAVLGKGRDYKLGSRDMHGSKDVVDLVENTPCAIGFSGLAYATEHVKMPCIMREQGADCVAPSVEAAIDKSYPIARPLFMYTRGVPEGPVKSYLDWILSDTGQCIIRDKGYAPVSKASCG